MGDELDKAGFTDNIYLFSYCCLSLGDKNIVAMAECHRAGGGFYDFNLNNAVV